MANKRMRLTKSTVDRLKPADRDYEVADESLPGLYLRVYANGAKVVVIRYKVGARQRRFSIGKVHQHYTFVQARRDAAAKLRAVRGGEDPSLDRRRRRQAATMADVAARFMAEHAEPRLKPTTQRNYRADLRDWILPALGPMPIEEITTTDVERLHAKVGKVGKYRANRVLALVSSIMTRAERWGYRSAQTNPCRTVGRFPEAAKERHLHAAERARLDAVLVASERAHKGEPDYVCHGSTNAVRLLLATGCRCSEITGLTWAMVDLEGGFLRLPDSKTGAKVVLLSRQAVELLRELHEHRRPEVAWVCAGESGGRIHNIQRAWQALRRRAGLDGVRLHDLRHSLASDAAAVGASLQMIGKMLGHKSPQTAARYSHLVDDVVRPVLDRTGDRIEQQIQDGAAVIDLDAHRKGESQRPTTKGRGATTSKRRRR